eukprot:gene31237-37748_t
MAFQSSISFDPSRAVEISGALNILKKHVVKAEAEIDKLVSAVDSPLYILRSEIMVKDTLCPVRRLCVKNVDLPGWVLNIDAKFCRVEKLFVSPAARLFLTLVASMLQECESKRRLSVEFVTKHRPEVPDNESQKSETENMLTENQEILRSNLLEAEEQLNIAHNDIEYMRSQLEEAEYNLDAAKQEATE